jgi:hypothetical protein
MMPKKASESSNRSDVGKKCQTHEDRCNYYNRFLTPLKSLAIGTMMLTAGMSGAEARLEPALQRKGHDNITGLTSTFNQTEFNNLSHPTAMDSNPYTYKVTPELLDHLRNVGVPDPEQLIRHVQQGRYDDKTSSEQREREKPLSSNKEKIALRRSLTAKLKENLDVLQLLKELNDKKVRGRSLLERSPEVARVLQEQSDYTYTTLSSNVAHTELNGTQAFKNATRYLGEQPDWNNIYTYKSKNTTAKGIIVMYPNSTTFLAIDNPSAGTDTIGLIGHLAVQSGNKTTLTWSTPQGETFAEQIIQNGKDTTEALFSIASWGKFIWNVKCFLSCLGPNIDAECGTNIIGCIQRDLSSCVALGLCAGPEAIECAKQCFGS